MNERLIVFILDVTRYQFRLSFKIISVLPGIIMFILYGLIIFTYLIQFSATTVWIFSQVLFTSYFYDMSFVYEIPIFFEIFTVRHPDTIAKIYVGEKTQHY